MKNGDLIVRGVRADCLDVTKFAEASDMTYWELGDQTHLCVYEEYDRRHGQGACERDKIDTLEDLFGTAFSDAFFKQKRRLIAQANLASALAEKAELEQCIRQYEYTIKTGEPWTETAQ